MILIRVAVGDVPAAGVVVEPVRHLDGVHDPLEPGDIIIETRRGDLDGCIETQLAEIERGFADRLKR